jgi:hypothetical protein
MNLTGMDEVLAENFVIIDANMGGGGGGSTVKVNGSTITNPNFNDTTPAAPAGGVNVLWQVSSDSVSAYILNSSLAPAWSSLTGTLSNGQVIPYADAGISRLGAASLAIGNGTDGDFTGSLKANTFTASLAGSADISLSHTGVSGALRIAGSTQLYGDGSTILLLNNATRIDMQLGFVSKIVLTSGRFDIGSQVLSWNNNTGISQLSSASLAIGNGTNGDTTGNLQLNTIGLNGSPASALTASKLYIVGDVSGSPQGNPIEIHSTFANGINAYTHSDTSFRGPALALYRSRGTQAAPTSVVNGSSLGYLSYGGYDGSAYAVGAQITVGATETWGTSAHGSNLSFNVVNAAGTSVQERMRIQGLGVHLPASVVFGWDNVSPGTLETGFSRFGAASVALGNGTVGDFSGSLKLSTLTLGGSSSGTASISVPAAAGTPNTLLLPTTTGTSGQVLVTDGANPQQLSWSSAPSISGTVGVTGQTASIGTSSLVASATAGVYRISYYMKITTAGSVSGSVTLTLSYTDRDDSVVVTYVVPTPANATDSSSVVSGTLVVDAKAATAITYATTYASSGTAMAYKLRLKAEAL